MRERKNGNPDVAIAFSDACGAGEYVSGWPAAAAKMLVRSLRGIEPSAREKFIHGPFGDGCRDQRPKGRSDCPPPSRSVGLPCSMFRPKSTPGDPEPMAKRKTAKKSPAKKKAPKEKAARKKALKRAVAKKSARKHLPAKKIVKKSRAKKKLVKAVPKKPAARPKTHKTAGVKQLSHEPEPTPTPVEPPGLPSPQPSPISAGNHANRRSVSAAVERHGRISRWVSRHPIL